MRHPQPGVTDAKELYEHLEVLHHAVDGTTAEASFQFLVDTLLRHTVHHSPQVSQEANDATRAISRWQRHYLATDATSRLEEEP